MKNLLANRNNREALLENLKNGAAKAPKQEKKEMKNTIGSHLGLDYKTIKRELSKAQAKERKAERAKLVEKKRAERALKKEKNMKTLGKTIAKEAKQHKAEIERSQKITNLLTKKLNNPVKFQVTEQFEETILINGQEIVVPVSVTTWSIGDGEDSKKLLARLTKAQKAAERSAKKQKEEKMAASFAERIKDLGLSVSEFALATEYSESTVYRALKGKASERAVDSIDSALHRLEILEKDHLFEELKQLDLNATRNMGLGSVLHGLRAKSQNLNAHFAEYVEISSEELLAEGGFSFSDSLTRDTRRKDLNVKEMRKRLDGFAEKHDLDLEGELEELVAEQFKDSSVGTLGYNTKIDREIKVVIQELTPRGNWKTLRDENEMNHSITIPVEEFARIMDSEDMQGEMLAYLEEKFSEIMDEEIIIDGYFQRAMFTGSHLHTWTDTNHNISSVEVIDGEVFALEEDEGFEQTVWINLEGKEQTDPVTLTQYTLEDKDVDDENPKVVNLTNVTLTNEAVAEINVVEYGHEGTMFIALQPNEAHVQADHEFNYAMNKHNEGIMYGEADSITRSIAEIADIKNQMKAESIEKKKTSEFVQAERRAIAREQVFKSERRERALNLILENKEIARKIIAANYRQSLGDDRAARKLVLAAVKIDHRIAKDICVKMKQVKGENYLTGKVYSALNASVNGKVLKEKLDPKALEILKDINNNGRGEFKQLKGDAALLDLVVTTGQTMFKQTKQAPVADKKVWMDLVRLNRAAKQAA